MAAVVETGMDKQEMKHLLGLSRNAKAPVNCAIGQGDDSATALLLLDKVKQPKGLEQELRKQFDGVKNTRFGTAFVDPDFDAKMVQFSLNKPVTGMAKRLVKTLKGTGFSKVKLSLDDGTALETDGEDEDGAAAPPEQPPAQPAQATAPAPEASTPTPAAPPPATPASDQAAPAVSAAATAPPGADFGALQGRLVGLVRRLLKADPSQRTRLKGLAEQAQAGLQAQDAAATSAAIDQLRAALDAIDAAPAAPDQTTAATAPDQTTAAAAAPDQTTAAAAAPDQTTAATFAKARVAWVATRQKLETDIDKLQTTFVAAFKDHAMADDLSAAFQSRVETVLQKLDVELASKLDAVAKTADPAEHAKLVGEARQIMQRYQTYVANDPTLTEIDANPFVPLTIQKTLVTTLSVLSKAIG